MGYNGNTAITKPTTAGELAVGATVVRTDVWAHPTEPAITSAGRALALAVTM